MRVVDKIHLIVRILCFSHISYKSYKTTFSYNFSVTLIEWSTVAVNECDSIILLRFMACAEHRQRHFNMSQCREGGVSLSSLCELHVSEPASVIFLSPSVSVCSVCGSQEGSLLAGSVAQLSSPCLRQPLGQSRFFGRSSAGATSELACKRENRRNCGDSRTARAVEAGKIPVCIM